MNKKELMEWKSRVSMSPPKWVLYSNLWDLAGSILEAGEITDELFKRTGEMLTKKIMGMLLAKRKLDYRGLRNLIDILRDKNE